MATRSQTASPAVQSNAVADDALVDAVTPPPTLLYHQTIIPTQSISHTVEGSFTLPNADDMVVIRHNTLELWTLHGESGTAECVHNTPLFANVYAAVAVPTSSAANSSSSARASNEVGGANGESVLDASPSVRREGISYLAITTEAGYVSLLRYELAEQPVPTQVSLGGADGSDVANMCISTSLKGSFVLVSDICLGRSGARLTVPGAKMTVDTRGEALFITALMFNKIVIPICRTDATQQDLIAAVNAADGFDVDDDDEGTHNREDAKTRHKRLHSTPKGVIALGSPIEAHRHTVIHSICALEGLTDQTVFAALEQDVLEAVEQKKNTDATLTSGGSGGETGAFLKLPGRSAGVSSGASVSHKYLVVYAYVPSLQQVQRTHLVKLPNTAHRLVPVPSEPCGPGGILVCTDTELVWYDMSSQQQQQAAAASPTSGGGVFKCSVPLPRRESFIENSYDPTIIRHAVARVARNYFLLLQDEHGDLFRVLLTTAEVQKAYDALRVAQRTHTGMPIAVPNPLVVHYYDTIPPTSDMALFRKGYLFTAVESGPLHRLYKITQDGYTKESEYITRRVRGIMQSSAASGGVKSEDVPGSRKRERDGGSMGPPPPLGAGAMAMPTPMPHSRVITVYQPHRNTRHMSMTQAYPNTPPIVSFTTAIPGTGPTGTEDASSGRQQPQVQVNAVAGRGSDSVLLNARFGYATRRESQFLLPASFLSVMTLASSFALQQLSREQQEVMAQASQLLQSHPSARSGGREVSSSTAAKLKALRRILAAASQQATAVCTDKVMLTTTQGTTVLHIGRNVELDSWSGFITTERTLAAATLKYGSGYLQVTQRGIYVIPSSPMDAQNSLLVAENSTNASTPFNSNAIPVAAAITVESTNWIHPHSKMILAAAATPTTVLVSFAQGGGIASFDMGLTNTQLRQVDHLPTFPAAPAVALLQPPASSQAGGALQGELKTILFRHGGASATAGSDHLSLAAVATIAQEVYLFDPRKLREPLERINCQREGGASGGEVVSLLLTYLGGVAHRSLLATTNSTQQRLFCFIGHLDGSLTRCELDPASAKVLERVELQCGDGPCHVIGGNGETVCYVQAGRSAWRCDVKDGVPKTVPWRFTSHQTAFAPFTLPRQANATLAEESVKTEESGLSVKEEPGEENGEATSSSSAPITMTLTATATATQAEHVIGVRNKELSLFSAQQTGEGASSLEYSFGSHSLPMAGRRILQHPTRPQYAVIASTEHRGYGMEAVIRARNESAATSGIPPTAPERSFGKEDVFNSSIQLYNEVTNHVSPAYYLPEGDAITSMAVGSFSAAFGKEPVVIVGTASHYTHGAGCGGSPSWTKGWLHAYRFTTNVAGSDGHSVLQIQPLHKTLIRTDGDGQSSTTGGILTADYASALHICEDVGLLFVGLGDVQGLRVYTWGQQQLLRKRQLPNVPARIIAIEAAFVSPPSGTSAAASPYYLSDLYQCPHGNAEAARRAREKQLLIFCATATQSVFIASLQSAGSGSTPSFLMIVGRDAVPRCLTSLAVMHDGQTVAVADKAGNVVFLRPSANQRFGFATSVDHMRDAEVKAAYKYLSEEQILEEVASHATGQLVTSLRVQPYDPSGGADPTLATDILYYSTALGALGSYVPFVAEEDATLAAYLQPLLRSHMRLLIAGPSGVLPAPLRGRLTAAPSSCRAHNVIEGDLLNVYRQASSAAFTVAAKVAIEEDLTYAIEVEGRRREHLGLPPLRMPLVVDLVAKQRALVTLPQ